MEFQQWKIELFDWYLLHSTRGFVEFIQMKLTQNVEKTLMILNPGNYPAIAHSVASSLWMQRFQMGFNPDIWK